MEDIVQHVLANTFGKSNLTPVHFEGVLLLPEDDKYIIQDMNNNDMINPDIHNIVVKILMDTGALCVNYVSKNLINPKQVVHWSYSPPPKAAREIYGSALPYGW
jgi:hypothetical protein